MKLPVLVFLSLLLVSATADEPVTSGFTVTRGEFVKTLTFSGELLAIDNVTVSVPRTRRAPNPMITYLAREGSFAEPGDILVEFDSSELETRRLDLEQRREDARIAIALKEAELETQRQDLLLALETARKSLNVAKLYVDIEPELIPRADAEKYEFDQKNATIDFEKAQEKLVTLAKTRAAEMEVVNLEFNRTDIWLQRSVFEINKMTVRAPMSGMVIYAENLMRGGKVQVGDALWHGTPVMQLPNMDRLRVETYVYDSDFPFLTGGESAEVVLDAVPDRVFTGRVAATPEIAKSRTFRSQLKAFRVDVLLDAVDLDVMKPGMTARVRIPTTTGEGFVVPRAAVVFDHTGQSRVLKAGVPPAWVDVTLIDANETHVLVEGELSENEELVDPKTSLDQTSMESPEETVTVERQDLKFSITGSGTLAAERAVAIGPPPVRRIWRFKINSLAPEGTDIEPGDMLVSFDPSEVHKRLREDQANLEKVEEELTKTEASEGLKLKDLELQLEDARVQEEKTRNKLIQAREFESNLQVMEAQFEAELAKTRVGILDKKLASVRKDSELQLQILKDKQKLRQRRIQENEEALEAMTVEAKISGVVIYKTDWRNEKVRVGSEVYRMQQIMLLPDLDTLVIHGQVAEVDAGKLTLGQKVEVSLDALPDQVLEGTVKQIDTIFKPASFDRPVKMLQFTVELDDLNKQTMLPGMVAKLQVLTARFEDVIAIPLALVHVEEGESFVWVQSEGGLAKRPVRVGKDNGVVAVIEEGLAEGDQVISLPLGGDL